MNEKQFRKWAKDRDLIVRHSRRVIFGWSLSVKFTEEYTLCVAKTLEELQDWAFSDKLKKELAEKKSL